MKAASFFRRMAVRLIRPSRAVLSVAQPETDARSSDYDFVFAAAALGFTAGASAMGLAFFYVYVFVWGAPCS